MPDCLIIDDEAEIASTICEYFELFDVSCEYATDYETGLRIAQEKQPSLILLDVNLGGRSGFTLCKTLRESSDVPILFISARNTDDDVLTALGVGGDDYITKPFSMVVLLAKTKAMLKRSAIAPIGEPIGKPTSEQIGKLIREPIGKPIHEPIGKPIHEPKEIIRFGSVEIDRDSDRVSRNGVPVKLRPLELKLLLYLFDNRGRRVTKDELLEKVWGDTFVGEGTLSVHIRHLREKLESDPKNPHYIKTMWGSGYMFEALS
ncbi:MAG: response regulator transcription factor [Oscillospiraceae bacterium]|nr:response regulator transcription factor [Oscillospiraceae bacterium]